MYIKILDIFRPLQVWSNMSKIHKFRPFCNHCRYGKPDAKTHKNLDFFRPLQVWSNMLKIHKFRPFPTTVDMVNHM